jgi:hypothetical protein
MFRILVLLLLSAATSPAFAQANPPPANPVQGALNKEPDAVAPDLAKDQQAQRKLAAAAARFFDRSNERRKEALKKAKNELLNATSKLRQVERKPVIPGAKADDDRGFATAESKLRWIQSGKKYVATSEQELRAVEEQPQDYPYVLALPLKVDDIGAIPHGKGNELAKTDDGQSLIEVFFEQPTREKPDARTATALLINNAPGGGITKQLPGTYRVVGTQRRVINGVQVNATVLEPVDGRAMLLAEYQKRGLLPAKAVAAPAKHPAHLPRGKDAAGQPVNDGVLSALSAKERVQLLAARSEAQRNEYIAVVLADIAELKQKQAAAKQAPIDPNFNGGGKFAFRDEASKIAYLATFADRFASKERVLAALERNLSPHVFVFSSPPKPGEIGRFPPAFISVTRVSDTEAIVSVPHPDCCMRLSSLHFADRDKLAPQVSHTITVDNRDRAALDRPPTKYLVLGDFANNGHERHRNNLGFHIEVLGRERRVVLGVPIEILVAKQVDAAELLQQLRVERKANPANDARPDEPPVMPPNTN